MEKRNDTIMLKPEEVISLLSDIESDRIERTISTTNTDKFGQAICAFANDLPNHNQPGYLIIGADDKTGKVSENVVITDQLLQNLGAIRTDGKLQPQVSMTVEKVALPDGAVAVVTVQPCQFTPVRYDGRVWVRVGPRKGIANESDERRLLEKRTSRMLTFDALPCVDAEISDLDISTFKQIYLPKAFPEDVLKRDQRSVEQQMQALGFYSTRFNCPTYAGIILFGNNPERFLPGCYVQYVRFSGKSRSGKVLREYKFAGNLTKVLYQLDTFVDATITNRRPVPVSALREEMKVDYPHWATRELLMNAICHRDYEGNGPVQFYQYDDRIEIMNPGGLYGKATPENFPYVNDYRNGVVAEAMKVLGFVNRYSRGVQTVQDELEENGNGKADFKLHLMTAFLVVENISKYASKVIDGNEKVKEGDGKVIEEGEKVKEGDEKVKEGDEKVKEEKSEGKKNEGKKSEERKMRKEMVSLPNFLGQNPKATYAEISKALYVSETTVYRWISDLKTQKILQRNGGRSKGFWIVNYELFSSEGKENEGKKKWRKEKVRKGKVEERKNEGKEK